MSCNEWKSYKLGEIMDISSSKRIYAKEYISNGIPFYRGKEIIEKFKGNEVSTELFISEERFKELKEKFGIPKKGDILLTSVGTLGVPYLVQEEEFYFKDGNLTWFKNFNINCCSEFIYYWIQSSYGVNQIYSKSIGSTQKALTIDMLKKFDILLPPLKEQIEISNILSSLDNKIKLNNEMNKTLEEMAQSIFKRWFVDFEFPNEDGQPYKSSGGEMVDSEFGMIPNGWEVKCIYDLAEYINGTSFKAKDYSEKGLPIIKIAELKNGVTDGTKFFSGEKDKKFYLKNGDILFSWSGNPDTSIDTFIWDKGDAILNQHIFKVIPKFDKGYAFTYLMLKYLKSTFTHIARNKQTTGLGHVTVKDLKELKIALCFSKIKEFNEVAQPIVDLIFENNMNIEQLNKIRDSLLPKLMSGEIRVK